MCLIQRALDARNIADTEGDGDAIEAAVGIGEMLGIALLEGNDAIMPTFGGELGAYRQHLGIDVADGHARARSAGLDHAERYVAGAAGEIEQGEVLVRA